MKSIRKLLQGKSGYIFDIDGTLLDSHESHYNAWKRITEKYGFHYERKDIFKHFGKTTPKIARALLNNDDDKFISKVSEEKAAYFLEEIPASHLIPGAMEILDFLKNDWQKKICLASSNLNHVIEKVVDIFKMRKLIDAYTGLDDITRGKPHPEMIITSARKIAEPPENCVVIGDSIYDIQSGNAAGAFTVGVETGIFSRKQLEDAGAGAVFSSVGSLLNEFKS
ncbi:MAG: HAD family hydrolase [Promethearchaeota archaeon]